MAGCADSLLLDSTFLASPANANVRCLTAGSKSARSLVKFGNVDGRAKYTEEKIAALCLEASAAKRTSDVEHITHEFRKALEDHIRECEISWALKL
jgi:hypothetical protein